MKSTIIHSFAIIGVICTLGLLTFIVIFGPGTYRFFRNEYRGQFPFTWPVWVYRLRRWIRLEWAEIRNRRDQVGGILLLLIVLGLLFVSLVAGCPYE